MVDTSSSSTEESLNVVWLFLEHSRAVLQNLFPFLLLEEDLFEIIKIKTIKKIENDKKKAFNILKKITAA